MGYKFRTFLRSRSVWAFVLAFVFAVSAGLSLTASLEKQRMKIERERAVNVTEIQASRLTRAVDHLLSVTETLRALLEVGHGEIPQFQKLGPDITEGIVIRNISMAPNGIITEVYPIPGNEDALGHDVLNDPARSQEARLAMESGKLTLSGPYELRQGGIGLIGRLPVYRKSQNGENEFWGFTCVTVDMPQGLRDAGMEKLEEQGYAYELWRISPDTNAKQMIMSSRLPVADQTVEELIELPNSTWHLNVSPVSGWSHKNLTYLELTLTAVFALLFAFLAKSGVELEESRRSLSSTLIQQTANYRLMDNMNESLRAFRHDIGNHLMSLHYLLNKGDLDAASAYIGSISETLADTARIINTENYVFDAILADKFYEAGKLGIHTERDISIPGHLNVENGDWSTLFGNAMDNALEACIRSLELKPETVPMIRVSARCRSSMLQICITNTALRPAKTDDGKYVTEKKDEKNHGIGMKQMKAIVKKYDGVIETSWEDGVFTLTFMLLHV